MASVAHAIPTFATPKIQSAITYPQHDRYLAVHCSLQRAVGGDFGDAVILSALLFRYQLMAAPFRRTLSEMEDDVQGALAARTIRERLRPDGNLTKLGFVKTSMPPGDNRDGMLFELDIERIQQAVCPRPPRQKPQGYPPAKLPGSPLSNHHPSNQEEKPSESSRSKTTCTFSGGSPPEKPSIEEKAKPAVQPQPAEHPDQPATEEPKNVVAFTKPVLPPRVCDTDRQELAFRFEQRFGMSVERDVLDHIESDVTCRGRTLRDFLEELWPHWALGNPNKFTNPVGFMRGRAKAMSYRTTQMNLALSYMMPLKPPVYTRCERCKGVGATLDGVLCDCPTGRDLALQQARKAKKPAAEPPAAQTMQSAGDILTVMGIVPPGDRS